MSVPVQGASFAHCSERRESPRGRFSSQSYQGTLVAISRLPEHRAHGLESQLKVGLLLVSLNVSKTARQKVDCQVEEDQVSHPIREL